MKDLLGLLKKQLAKEETKRYLRFLALPFVVVVLIIVIVLADKPGRQGEETQDAGIETESQELSESQETEETTESQPAEPEYRLSDEEMPEIKELMENYLKARRTCDRETLSGLYGGTCTGEELDRLMERLEEEVKFYQDFQNVTCKTVAVPGTEDLIVYAGFDVKFRQADTMAPTLLACYVKKAADGTYYLEGAVSPEESSVMEEANRTAAVQDLAKTVNEGLRQALNEDDNLLAVYNTLTGRGFEVENVEETEPTKVQIAEPGQEETAEETEADQTQADETSQTQADETS